MCQKGDSIMDKVKLSFDEQIEDLKKKNTKVFLKPKERN